MTKQEVAALACRTLGIFALLQALGALQFAGFGLMALGQPSGPGTDTHLLAAGSLLTSTLLPTLLFAAAGLFLWIKANWLARRMTAGIVADAEMKIGASDLLGAAIPVVGLFVLAQAVPHVCEALGRLWLQARGAQLGNGVVPDTAGRTAVNWATVAAQVALGLWLLLGGQDVAEILRVRQRGKDRSAIEIAAP